MLKNNPGFVSCVSTVDLVGLLSFLTGLICQGELLFIKYVFTCTSCFSVALWDSEYILSMYIVHITYPETEFTQCDHSNYSCIKNNFTFQYSGCL